MKICEKCGKEFLTIQAKASHIRWHHKDHPYTIEGLERLRLSSQKTAEKIFGVSKEIIETRICKCGKSFQTTFRTNRTYKGKKCCSIECAARREHTKEVKAKISSTIKNTLKTKPELRECYISNLLKSDHSRSSSNAERSLYNALLLKSNKFKRHFLVKTQDLIFDVDISTLDKKVWIESDGEWHFRKVHEGHNFELTQLRDKTEENEAIIRNVLLLRVNNQTTTIEQQCDFVFSSIDNWDGITGKILKFGFSET